MDRSHFIAQDKTLLEALSQLNGLGAAPLVLFVTDDRDRMVGTLTDGDSRRALIAGASVNDRIDKVMHRDFRFMRIEALREVQEIRRHKQMQVKLIPVLDSERRIVDVIDLQRYKTRLPVDAVLMAGGKGERLRPLTEKMPKPLLKVGAKSIIDYNIDRLIDYGITNISVTVNYLAELMEMHFAACRQPIRIKCIREPRYLGTIGSIHFVDGLSHDTVLVMNSDLFTNIDYEEFYLHFCRHDADMSIAAVPYSISVPYGIFDLEERNVLGLVEKPTYNYYANAGIYLIKRSVLNEIPEDTFFNATDLIKKLISERRRVIRFPLNGTWIDIGSHQEYQKANELVKHLAI